MKTIGVLNIYEETTGILSREQLAKVAWSISNALEWMGCPDGLGVELGFKSLHGEEKILLKAAVTVQEDGSYGTKEDEILLISGAERTLLNLMRIEENKQADSFCLDGAIVLQLPEQRGFCYIFFDENSEYHEYAFRAKTGRGQFYFSCFATNDVWIDSISIWFAVIVALAEFLPEEKNLQYWLDSNSVFAGIFLIEDIEKMQDDFRRKFGK